MKKILLCIFAFLALFTLKTNNLNAQIYNYFESMKFQRSVQQNEINDYAHNYSVAFCKKSDREQDGRTWDKLVGSLTYCRERGVLEFIHITPDNKKISRYVGYQHWKQDVFFNNLPEALGYVFDKPLNKAHWAWDVHGQRIWLNDYGVQLGQHNQRNSWNGRFENVWSKWPNNKWMYRNGDYFVTNRRIKIGIHWYTFDKNSYLVGRRSTSNYWTDYPHKWRYVLQDYWVKNKWYKIGIHWYKFNKDGDLIGKRQMSNHWDYYHKKWRYVKGDDLVVNKTIWIGHKYYTFNKYGYLVGRR